MAEELPDGTKQGYFNICKNCGKEIEVNMQGNPLNHKCMKKFILITQSESCDHYHYFIQSEEKPTNEQIDKFLQEHANDKDDEEVYEYMEQLFEIKDEKFITI